jgi:putative transcriptional regulator
MVSLKLTTPKSSRFPKLSVPGFIAGFIILPVVLLAYSSFDASNGAWDVGGSKEYLRSPLREPGGLTSGVELAKGRFLVAGRRLNDPNFRETVVLLMSYGRDGAAGLVINRPLNVRLFAVMPEIKELEQRKENLYLGGPVEPNKVLLLLKSTKTPADAIPVFDDVYVSSSRKELRRIITKADKNERFRIYAGYAGWAPKQLESERERGDWHVLKADAETLFDKKSSEIWQELIHRFTVNWVHLKTHDGSRVQRFNVGA